MRIKHKYIERFENRRIIHTKITEKKKNHVKIKNGTNDFYSLARSRIHDFSNRM